ncbi:MAG TPA: PIG-L family deacetylase [Polyangiaceae bacterium]|nr:PIG-L family deacetylase [Polyangiaceae bacterium]
MASLESPSSNRLKLSNPDADVFVPDGAALDAALTRTTYLGIGAHADDLEIFAAHGILAGFQSETEWFAGVVVTDGRGSSRGGPYAELSDAALREVRRREQRKAAYVGEYAAQLQLDFQSASLRDGGSGARRALVADLEQILRITRPRVVYTHNLADAHATHVVVALAAIEACKRLEPERRPTQVWGCEVWRDLDWLSGADRKVLPLSSRSHVQQALLGVFDSQIAANKRYDLATQGRRQANATFDAAYSADATSAATLAMDLLPVVEGADAREYVARLIERFKQDALDRLRDLG